MNRNCDECKFENTLVNSEPCFSCMDFEHTQWQPKEEPPTPITYTREEVLELMANAALDVARIKYLPNIRSHKDVLDNFDKLKNQKK